MPTTAPLDTLEYAINLVRVRLLDAIAGLAGDIFTDTAPSTLTAINGGWRRFQEALVNYGVAWFKPETILPGVPPVGNADPGSQVYLNWANYFNGTTLSPSPVLPQNLISPMVLWERPTGNGSFFPMDRLDNGLPAVPKGALNRSWEWRNGAIYMPGATSSTDLRIRYAAFFPDFLPSGTGTGQALFNSQYIPIVRAVNPLAWFICSEVARARGDIDAQTFDQNAMQSTKMMFDLEPMQARSVGAEAEYGKMPDKYSATMGPSGPRGQEKG
jgi:hypothetical protein